MLMNANSGWPGQQVFPQMPQQNHQATGFQQSQIQPGFQNQGMVNQPMNLGQQFGGQMVNPMFHTDRAPQRHVEVYQQAPDPQPPHRFVAACQGQVCLSRVRKLKSFGAENF